MADKIVEGTQPTAEARQSENVDAGIDEKRFSQDELNTFLARERKRAGERSQIDERKAWLERLGSDSTEAAEEQIKLFRQGIVAPPKKSEVERVSERLSAEYEGRIAAAEGKVAAAEARANSETIRAFLLRIVGDTNDTEVAMSLFGVGFVPEERLVIRDEKLSVEASDGTPLPHKDPEKWARGILAQPKYAYLRKSTYDGTGVRVSSGQTTPNAGAPLRAARNTMEQAQQMRAIVERVIGTDGTGAR